MEEWNLLTQFGSELRRRRIAAELSLSGLSRLVHYDKGHLSKIERGIKQPCQDLAYRCDTVLGASGELAALARSLPVTPDLTSDDLGQEWLMTFEVDGCSHFSTLSRRDVLAVAGGVFMTVGSTASATGHDDDETVAGFRAVFDMLRRLSQHVAPAELVPCLVTLTRTLQARTGQPDMLVLAARFAEFTGWMVQEGGDERAAIRWTNHATDLATRAGDDQMIAYRYVRHADVALYRHDGSGTVNLAQRAQREPGSSRVYSLAAQREAQGHAIAGDYNACRRALDRAAHYVDEPDEVDTGRPVLGTSTVADPVAITTGWCLQDLARSRDAADILAAEVARIPQQAVRAQARYGVRLALALASMHELEQSCATLTPILRTLPRIDSATVRTDLRRLSQMLGRWRHDVAVRMIMADLSAALRAPAG